MRVLGLLLVLWSSGFAQGIGVEEEAAFWRCREVAGLLRPLALYEVRGRSVLVLGLVQGPGQRTPLVQIALGPASPLPLGHPGERVFPSAPPSWLEELTLARMVVRRPWGYACFLVHRGLVVGVLRLDVHLEPLPIPDRGRLRKRY